MAHQHGGARPAPGTTAAARYRNRMAWVLAVLGLGVLVQVIGALVSGSLALLADAGHMLTDGLGVAVALVATILAARPAREHRTFGLQRAEILAALVNGLVVGGLAVAVIVGALIRLGDPTPVDGLSMLLFAVVGLLANAVCLVLLMPGRRESLNVRGAYLEVLGDLLGSIGVVLASVIIMITGWLHADAVASLLIGLMILPRAFALLRSVTRVLLEAAPEGLDLNDVRSHILGVEGVVGVHDLHAWTITSGVPVLTAHVVVEDDTAALCGSGAILDQLHRCLDGHFDVEHSTFQIEPVGHVDHEHADHA